MLKSSESWAGPGLTRSERELRRYETLGDRGELAKTVMDLVETKLIGTPESVHGKLVALREEGVLKDEPTMGRLLVKFRTELYATLRERLRLSDEDWKAIERKRHEEWLDAPPKLPEARRGV